MKHSIAKPLIAGMLLGISLTVITHDDHDERIIQSFTHGYYKGVALGSMTAFGMDKSDSEKLDLCTTMAMHQNSMTIDTLTSLSDREKAIIVFLFEDLLAETITTWNFPNECEIPP